MDSSKHYSQYVFLTKHCFTADTRNLYFPVVLTKFFAVVSLIIRSLIPQPTAVCLLV